MFVALVMEWCAMCVLGVCGRPGVHGPGDPRDWRLWPHHQVLGGAHRSLHPHAAAPRQPGEPNLQQNPVSNIYSGFALDKGTGDADVFCSRWTVWQSPVTAACWPREATSTSGCSTSPLATSTPWSTTAASARTWWRSGSRRTGGGCTPAARTAPPGSGTWRCATWRASGYTRSGLAMRWK